MSKIADWVKRMLLMFFGLTTIQATCNKSGLDCTKVTNRFVISAKVTPDNDTIKAGDSLVLEISESTNFVDVNTGQSINFSNAANLGTAIGFQRYDSLARFWRDAAESFRFYLVEGKLSGYSGLYAAIPVIPTEKMTHVLKRTLPSI